MSDKKNRLLYILSLLYREADEEHPITKTNTHIYEDSKGIQHTKVHTKWTQKGRLFIYEQLKADGIYPQIEMEV